MLRIRPNQMSALSVAETEKFVRRAIAHVRENFSEEVETLGPAGTSEAVRYGLQRAQDYGFKVDGQVLNYLNLMFTFGRDFDRDESLSWAREVLSAEQHPAQKMDLLYNLAMDHEADGAGFSASPS